MLQRDRRLYRLSVWPGTGEAELVTVLASQYGILLNLSIPYSVLKLSKSKCNAMQTFYYLLAFSTLYHYLLSDHSVDY